MLLSGLSANQKQFQSFVKMGDPAGSAWLSRRNGLDQQGRFLFIAAWYISRIGTEGIGYGVDFVQNAVAFRWASCFSRALFGNRSSALSL